MQTPNFDQLLDATCHFGHLKRKWNPAMAPYIFMERNGIHIIDLYRSVMAFTSSTFTKLRLSLKKLPLLSRTLLRKARKYFLLPPRSKQSKW